RASSRRGLCQVLCFKGYVLMTDYLKPIAEEERRIEAEEKKKREELERIAKELAE
ncbi:PREDICTED: ATP synthase subunit e, mitochondrial, partial [Buceros rhinoceros silvestris]|uniref:ATP synthase subunit e, mitochondrial n=1 Tax=Buceros rhinoceros silvestris TaxID=175836 RepID=UPI0005282FF5